MNRKISIGLGALAVLGIGLLAWCGFGWARFEGPINALGVDLRAPHAYVDTPSLSRLPRDLVKAPVLRELLSEDFAFYYEDHEDRLGLRGAIRRIAFEHEQTLGDELLDAALDEPAEVALWTDAKGAPRHWLLAMTRGALARTLQGLAVIAAKDRQLRVIDEIIVGGSKLTVLSLSLSSRRTLALLSRGNRVVVLSDPGLLFDAQRMVDARAAEVIGELLSGEATSRSLYRAHFGLRPAEPAHVLLADARLLSFGWQHFFPGLQALRVELAPGGAALRTHLRVAGRDVLNALADPAPWSALPHDPAACALLPADWQRAQAVLGTPDKKAAALPREAVALAGQLVGPAAICWYPRSQLHTPLLLARTREGRAVDAEAVAALMRWWLPPRTGLESDDAGEGGADGVQRWQADVEAPYGRGQGGYRPTLARRGAWWLFSPDAELVAQALDTLARRYPSVADTLPAGGTTLAVATPAGIAGLAQREAFAVLTPRQAAFRQAAEELLVPRLEAFGRLAPARAVLDARPDAQGWVPLQWQPMRAEP